MRVVDLLGLVRRDYEDRRLRSMPSAVASMGHVAMHLGELALPLEPEDLSEYLHKRRAERAAEGTIRKFISLDSIPEFPKIDKRGLKVRQGYFTREEFNLLLRYLRFEELRDLIAFLYESAWRSGQAMHTQWEWVAHERILVPGEFTKNGKSQVLAVAGNIATIIERRRARAIGPYVFHRQGQRIRNFRHAWDTACLKAGLVQANGKPRLPHDLRRSGVTEMDEMGIDRKIGKSISGHLTDSTYERYHIGSLKAQREALEARANGGKKEPVRAGQKVVRLSDWGT